MTGDEEERERGTITLSEGLLFAERYEVRGFLGRGAMSAVYHVHDRVLDDSVALKLLAPEASADDLEAFRREVRLARRVTHMNVARTHDLGEHEGSSFLTMELVEGESLERLLARQRPLQVATATSIALQIAVALEVAHRAGVVHLDLKPSNVIMAADGRAVVTDFGIAKALGLETLRRTREIKGTPLYMSPEQVMASPVDERSDIYSLGLILYEMLTGEVPFGGEHPLAMAVDRLRKPAPDPRDRADVADDLAALVVSCLAIDSQLRPQTARVVREALEVTRRGSVTPGAADSDVPEELFAPLPTGRPTLAILPLRYRGPSDHDYLGEGLAEELIDLLSSTRTMRVLSLGATERFADDRNPEKIAESLGAKFIVDGTALFSETRIRISARLVEAPGGVQVWSDQFQADVTDILGLQEKMGRRIAETLRLEVQATAHSMNVTPEGQELYFRARRLLRRHVDVDLEPAVVLLSRCLAASPDFGPALAAHAMACSRTLWSMSGGGEGLERRAVAAVARAKERAPAIAETHLAAGILATEQARYRESAEALAEALSIAPTCAEAHYFLGHLQVEAGKMDEGLNRLELSLELDPTLRLSRLSLARAAALRGDQEAYEKHTAALALGAYGAPVPVLAVKMRAALWFGDMDSYARLVQQARDAASGPARFALEVGRYVLGEVDVSIFDPMVDFGLKSMHNARFRTIVTQVVIEAYAFRGELDRALHSLERATDDALVEIEWLDRCPTLEPLRGHEVFEDCAATVRERARAIWLG